MELPEIFNATLVEIGDRMPFYEGYMAGQQHVMTTPDNKVRVQISVLGVFFPVFGNISVLRGQIGKCDGT